MFCLYDLCNIVSLLLHSVSIVVIGFKTIFSYTFVPSQGGGFGFDFATERSIKNERIIQAEPIFAEKELFLNYFNYFKII